MGWMTDASEIFDMMLNSNDGEGLSRRRESLRHDLKRISVKLTSMRKKGVKTTDLKYRGLLARRARIKDSLTGLRKVP